MYRVVTSHLQNCFSSKVGMGKELYRSEFYRELKNIFSFISLSVKGCTSQWPCEIHFFPLYFTHSHGHRHVAVTPSDWWMCLTCREYSAHLEDTVRIQEYCQDFFCLDWIPCVTVWGASSTSAHSCNVRQWPGKGVCMSDVPFQPQILSSGRHAHGIWNWNKYNPEIRDITERGKNCTRGS